MEKPAAAEIRALPGIGVLGLIALVQWAQTDPQAKLWQSGLFQGAFVALLLGSIYGLFGFFQHWKLRAIAPAIIAVIYALVSFGQPTLYVLCGLGLAFLVVAYFVSPDRLSAAPQAGTVPANDEDIKHALAVSNEALQEAVKARDDAQLELAAYTAKQLKPDLLGKITGFQAVTDKWFFQEIPYASGSCYVVHMEIENFGAPSRIRDWQYILFLEGGVIDKGPQVAGRGHFSAPMSWPQLEYSSLDDVCNEYIHPGKLYHVLFHIVASVISHPIKSFEVRFTDDSGQEVICKEAAS